MNDLATNRKALRDYAILESVEAGIVLSGQEAKSAKTGGMTLQGAYARISGGQAELINASIKPYRHAGNLEDYDPARTRRLLLHKSEIKRLAGKIEEKGITLVPLAAYAARGMVKVKLGLGKSKKEYDKREDIRTRELNRKIQRRLRTPHKSKK